MFCDEALDAVEAVASNDLTPSARIAEHFATCRNCAAALASARRLESLLRARPAPKPSAQFTDRILAQVRRASWRSEQFVDAGFNIALVLIVLALASILWLALYATGVTSVGPQTLGLGEDTFVSLVRWGARWLPVYGSALALVLTALAIWWWAERDAAL